MPAQIRTPAILILLVVSGCLDSSTQPGPEGPEAATIQVLPSELTIPVGDSYVFQAAAEGDQAASLVWTAGGGAVSGDGAIATYTAPDEPGSYALMVSDGNGGSGSATILVEPLPSTDVTGETGADLIDAALDAGTLDVSTAALYKAYWAFADPRLPDQYRGNGAAYEGAMPQELLFPSNELSVEVQAQLEKFRLPPNAAGSWYRERSESASRSSRGPGAPNTQVVSEILGFEPIRGPASGGEWLVWFEPVRPTDRSLAERLVVDVTSWGLFEQALKVTPRSPGGEFLSFYLVPLANSIPAMVVTEAVPATGSGCSEQRTHVLLNRNYRGAALDRAVVHAMLRSFLWALSTGGVECAELEWLREAAAVWAETHFYPTFVEPEDRRSGLLSSYSALHHQSLHTWTRGEAYPLFVLLAQRAGADQALAPFVSTGQASSSYDLVDNAVPDGFHGLWEELAVQSFDGAPFTQLPLLLGTSRPPIHHNEFGPTNNPDERVLLDLREADEKSWHLGFDLAPASYVYVPFVLDPSISIDPPKRIHFKNPFFGGNPRVKTHLLYKRHGDAEWSHENLSDQEEIVFCLESPDQDYDDFVLIVSNGDWTAEQVFPGAVAEGFDHCEYEVEFVPDFYSVEGGQSVRLDVEITPTHPLEGKEPQAGQRFLQYHFSGVPALTRGGFSPFDGRTVQPFITYTADPDALDGSEAVLVGVHVVNPNQEADLVGQDGTTINVEKAPFEVQLLPDGATVQAGQTLILDVFINGQAPTSSSLVYVWGNTGTRGSLQPDPGTNSSSSSAVYAADEFGADGSDTVSVQIFDGTGELLGEASAIVHFEGLPEIMYQGALNIIQRFFDDAFGNPRVCLLAMVTFELKEGATGYLVRTHSSPEPPKDFTVMPPFTTYAECPDVTYMRNGVSGNTYHFGLTAGIGPASDAANQLAAASARFQGLVVDVTAQF